MNYYVSKYGKFGSLVSMIICMIFSVILIRLAIIRFHEFFSITSVVFMALGIGLCWSGFLYFPYQIFRSSPRFTTTNEYLECKHLFFKKRIYFKDITRIKINFLSRPLVMLDVYLGGGKLFEKFTKIDLSGLTPSYKYLLKEIEIKLHNNSPS